MKTYRLGNIEVLSKDIDYVTWRQSLNSMRELGKGWRFPTIDEMKYLADLGQTKGILIGLSGKSIYWVVDPRNAVFGDVSYVLEIYRNVVSVESLHKDSKHALLRPVRDI